MCARVCSVPCSMLLCARTSRGSWQPQAFQAPSPKVREYGMRLAGLSRQGLEAGQNQNGLEYFFSLAFGQQGWEQNSPVGWSCSWKIPTSLFSCVLCAWPSFRSEGAGPFLLEGPSGNALALSTSKPWALGWHICEYCLLTSPIYLAILKAEVSIPILSEGSLKSKMPHGLAKVT